MMGQHTYLVKLDLLFVGVVFLPIIGREHMLNPKHHPNKQQIEFKLRFATTDELSRLSLCKRVDPTSHMIGNAVHLACQAFVLATLLCCARVR